MSAPVVRARYDAGILRISGWPTPKFLAGLACALTIHGPPVTVLLGDQEFRACSRCGEVW